jgi:hypothetical protein
MDSLQGILQGQHKTPVTIHREVREDSKRASLGHEAISYMSMELARYMAVMTT